MSNPKATRYLTYGGDVTETVVGQIMGPTTLREMVTAVSAEYDSASDTTRVGFAYGAHDLSS